MYASNPMPRAWKRAKAMILHREYTTVTETDDVIVGTRPCGDAFCLIKCQEKLTVKKMRNIVADYRDHMLIIISLHGMTAFTKREISDNDIPVQLFTASEIIVSCGLHILNPPHCVLTGGKRDAIFREYSVQDPVACFPRIFLSDPFVKYYGYTPGTILAFKRHNGYNCSTDYFRIVST